MKIRKDVIASNNVIEENNELILPTKSVEQSTSVPDKAPEDKIQESIKEKTKTSEAEKNVENLDLNQSRTELKVS